MALANDGVRVCCIRLAPYVYGRGGSGIKLFMNMWAQGDAGIYVDEGKARTTSVHVEDAARLYLLLAKKGRAGEEYNASYETHVTQGELAQAICKSIGVPCNSIPYKAAVSAMGEFFATFLALENRASNKKAKEEFGWEIMADKGVLEEIECGSYVKVAEEIKQKGAA
jgi:nucleoside-diphosphate-sugar epimerase